MPVLLDKIFNRFSLLIVNAVIILLTLTVGGGTFFYSSGLIIAVLFVILAASRVFGHYYTYDPVLEKFFHASLLAMAVLGVSHLIEFFSIAIIQQHKDTTFVLVANFYLVSLLSIIIGAEFFLKIRNLWSTNIQKICEVIIFILLAFSAVLLLNDQLVSLKLDGPAPYIYGAVLFVVGLIAFAEVLKIKHLTSIASGFVNFLNAGIVLIVLAALPNIFHELIENVFGVAEYKIVYLSHFTFYAALSLLFLAFEKLSFLGGVYEDLKREDGKIK
ncbi:MAG: hypothetical protein Q7R91_03125 [bacterium]|nr:hypothetical protein [bacterium]